MKDPRTIRMFRELDKELGLLGQKVNGAWAYERTPFVPSESGGRLVRAEIAGLRKRVDALRQDDPVYAVLAGHFGDYIESVETQLDGLYENASQALWRLGYQIYGPICGDYRDEGLRAELLLERFKAADAIWHEAVLPALPNYDADKLREAVFNMDFAIEISGYMKAKIREHFRSLSEAKIDVLIRANDEFANKLSGYVAHVQKVAEGKGAPPKSGPKGDDEVLSITQDEYRDALRNSIGVNLDELLSWYEEENAKTRAEALEIANRLDVAERPVKEISQVSDILFKYAGPCDSPEEMFRRVNVYLKRARAAAHDYIWLPEDEVCVCTPVPEMLKNSYPWGGYSGDHPSNYPTFGTMFLNNHNYTAVTDGWIKTNAVHEAYPGHHAQFIRCAIDPLPETFKRGAKHVPLTEGVCLRTERVFEFVFADDPFYPLQVAHRRHHTSTRIKVDLWLNYFGKTIGDACDLYEKEMGFDRKTARAQVQAHENMRGYFTAYYYGMKKICDWERALHFDRRAYTDLLFSVGRVSMDTFEKIVKLSPADLHSFQHDFASLIQFR